MACRNGFVPRNAGSPALAMCFEYVPISARSANALSVDVKDLVLIIGYPSAFLSATSASSHSHDYLHGKGLTLLGGLGLVSRHHVNLMRKCPLQLTDRLGSAGLHRDVRIIVRPSRKPNY